MAPADPPAARTRVVSSPLGAAATSQQLVVDALPQRGVPGCTLVNGRTARVGPLDAPRLRLLDEELLQTRRRFLVRALSLGLLAGGTSILPGCAGPVFGWTRTPELPPGRSIYRLSGRAAVNGRAATEDTSIAPGDTITTESGAELIFVVGKDAFIVRGGSHIQLEPRATARVASNGQSPVADRVVSGLRVITGSILSVFGQRGDEEALSVDTVTATIGVRGTGLYMEAEAERTYVCTCYGRTRLTATQAPSSTRLVTSQYHDAPYYILGERENGQLIEPAPVINHTDQELTLIEALVGRAPPFEGQSRGGMY